jgi:hypothetical protein
MRYAQRPHDTSRSLIVTRRGLRGRDNERG